MQWRRHRGGGGSGLTLPSQSRTATTKLDITAHSPDTRRVCSRPTLNPRTTPRRSSCITHCDHWTGNATAPPHNAGNRAVESRSCGITKRNHEAESRSQPVESRGRPKGACFQGQPAGVKSPCSIGKWRPACGAGGWVRPHPGERCRPWAVTQLASQNCPIQRMIPIHPSSSCSSSSSSSYPPS